MFESGRSYRSAASSLGVGVHPVKNLHKRWRIRGRLALMSKPTKQVYPFELKLEIVRRFLAGESAVELAKAHGVSSANLVKEWARQFRRDGEDALRPKRKGRPPGSSAAKPLSELDKLRKENQRLAAENAYLKKLRALMADEPQ